MISYIIKRLVFVVLTFFGILTIVFFITRIIPGDPAVVIAGHRATQKQIEAIRKEYGFDKPLFSQYAIYIQNLFTKLDLGKSVYTRGPVTQAIAQRFPATFELVMTAMLFAVVVGLWLGVLSAIKWNTLTDNVIRFFTIAGISLPGFWLALLLQMLFFFILGVLPAQGRIALTLPSPHHVTGLYLLDSLIARDFTSLVSSLRHLVLPAFTLSLGALAEIAKITRGAMLDVLHELYVVKARSIGLSERVVILKHALKNALLPVITTIGMFYGVALGGSVVVEAVFSWRGMGMFMYKGVIMADFNGIMGVTLVFSLVYLLLNFLVDVLCAWVNPIIKLE